jgi:NAD dependent epimerase/dehydratase family
MKVLITGSSGLIGSEAARYFDQRRARVYGIDNNMRADFFGSGGDTTWTLRHLQETCRNFEHRVLDIRDRESMNRAFEDIRPDLIIHCAAQPSHDLAKSRPFDDFDINATGTLNLLEATRKHVPDSVFILMSTNKVYGDVPNELPLVEQETRYDYAAARDSEGIDETCRIDRSTHSLFGVSKLAGPKPNTRVTRGKVANPRPCGLYSDAVPDCSKRTPVDLPLSVLEPLASGLSAVGGATARLPFVLKERNLEVGVWMLRCTWATKRRKRRDA